MRIWPLSLALDRFWLEDGYYFADVVFRWLGSASTRPWQSVTDRFYGIERRHQYANRHKCIHKYTSGLSRELGEELGVSKSRHSRSKVVVILSEHLFARRRWLRGLQLCGARKHLLEPDTNTLDDGEQDGAADGTVPRRLVSASNRQRAACEKPSDNRVVRIFLFPDALDCAVECAEQTTPDAEVASQYRGAHLDRCDGA
jgi:hypothetical protein